MKGVDIYIYFIVVFQWFVVQQFWDILRVCFCLVWWGHRCWTGGLWCSDHDFWWFLFLWLWDTWLDLVLKDDVDDGYTFFEEACWLAEGTVEPEQLIISVVVDDGIDGLYLYPPLEFSDFLFFLFALYSLKIWWDIEKEIWTGPCFLD